MSAPAAKKEEDYRLPVADALWAPLSPQAAAMKVRFKNPNLSNATPSMLVDELGEIKRVAAHLKKMEEYYKAALHAKRGEDTEVKGEKYVGQVSTGFTSRISPDLVREHGTPEFVDKVTVTSETSTLRISQRDDVGAVDE